MDSADKPEDAQSESSPPRRQHSHVLIQPPTHTFRGMSTPPRTEDLASIQVHQAQLRLSVSTAVLATQPLQQKSSALAGAVGEAIENVSTVEEPQLDGLRSYSRQEVSFRNTEFSARSTSGYPRATLEAMQYFRGG